jgi:heat shock protein HslJ
MRRRDLALAAIGSLGVACGVASLTGPEDSLRGPLWRLDSFETRDDGIITVQEPERYTLRFLDDGEVEVRADCNACSGLYRAAGSSLTVGPPLACTEVYCGEASLHDAYLEALMSVRSYELEGSQLRLAYEAGTLRFSGSS